MCVKLKVKKSKFPKGMMIDDNNQISYNSTQIWRFGSMSEEKKCIKSEVVCEGTKKLSLEELEKLSGGGNAGFNIEDWNGYAEPEKTK